MRMPPTEIRKKAVVTARLAEEELERFKAIAEREDRTVSQELRRLVRRHLEAECEEEQVAAA